MAFPLLAAMMVGGALMDAYGQNQQGKISAKLGKKNAAFEDEAAEDSLARGAEEQRRHRTRVRRFIGAQQAGLGASGLDIGSGLAADLQAEAAYLGELDSITIQNNSRREARGHRIAAENYRFQASNNKKAGATGAIATLLGGGAKSYSAFKDWQEEP